MTEAPINKILDQLREQVLNHLDDFLEICPDETDILWVRLFFENQIDTVMLMEGFIKWVYPWKEHIKDRNERFIYENDHMFGPLPLDKVYYFREKFRDGTFDQDDKDVTWEYFDVYVSLMDQYQKVK